MFRRLPVGYLASNATSLIGVVLVNTGFILWLMLLPSWWHDEMNHPYAGILANLILPLPSQVACAISVLPLPVSK